MTAQECPDCGAVLDPDGSCFVCGGIHDPGPVPLSEAGGADVLDQVGETLTR